MPYITKERRNDIEPFQGDVVFSPPRDAGELNFVLTRIIQDYLGRHYNYQKINDILGALEGCKIEFYRRVAVPYEERKIRDNGDCYEKR